MTSDPWIDLVPPSASSAINARRVDEDNPWGFFWARAFDAKYLLVLQHAVKSTPTIKLPSFRSFEVTIAEGDGHESRMLIFRLIDAKQRTLFHRLCLDIVSSAASAKSELEAVQSAIGRTWRWHHLLRGGTNGRLSEEEQKGLIGELFVLEQYLIPHFSPSDSVTAWRGPLDAPKDFEIARTAIEAKARRGAAKPHVMITSEHQLDCIGCDALFLHVLDVSPAPEGEAGAFTLWEAALRVRERIAQDNLALDRYEALLAASGFLWADDYSDCKWIRGAVRIYHVTEGFPRLTTSEVLTGVSDVRYSVSLINCEPFAVEVAALNEALKGGVYVK